MFNLQRRDFFHIFFSHIFLLLRCAVYPGHDDGTNDGTPRCSTAYCPRVPCLAYSNLTYVWRAGSNNLHYATLCLGFFFSVDGVNCGNNGSSYPSSRWNDGDISSSTTPATSSLFSSSSFPTLLSRGNYNGAD